MDYVVLLGAGFLLGKLSDTDWWGHRAVWLCTHRFEWSSQFKGGLGIVGSLRRSSFNYFVQDSRSLSLRSLGSLPWRRRFCLRRNFKFLDSRVCWPSWISRHDRGSSLLERLKVLRGFLRLILHSLTLLVFTEPVRSFVLRAWKVHCTLNLGCLSCLFRLGQLRQLELFMQNFLFYRSQSVSRTIIRISRIISPSNYLAVLMLVVDSPRALTVRNVRLRLSWGQTISLLRSLVALLKRRRGKHIVFRKLITF